MMKKIISTAIVVAIAIFFFVAGEIANSRMGSGAFSFLFTHTRCDNQKCVSTKGLGISQCSADSDCVAHMQCNNMEQCVAVIGAGTDKCSIAKDCQIDDPQAWCKSNNPGEGMHFNVIKYPDGNFSCDCYYINKDGTHSQTSCANSHLNQ